MPDPHDLTVRPMTREELSTAIGWAAAEGWNPGVHDEEIFWAADPDGFVTAELDGKMVGSGSIVSYGGAYGFMGLFIVRPEFRGGGLGRRLWLTRRDLMRARLEPNASVGMDGVFDMQPFYARGGFELFTRDLRFETVGRARSRPAGVVPLAEVDFAEVATYDERHFPAPRRPFLKLWIEQPESAALGVVRDGRLVGYGVVRRCLVGGKIGPLFADDAGIAEDLLVALAAHRPGEPLVLDVPENNPAAMALARRHGMREVFGCARMYLGPAPRLPDDEIFGVTTFELG